MTVVTGQDGALVADTLNADLTFHANGEKATNLWESMASFRGVSEGDSITYSLQRTEPLYTEHTAFRDAITSEDRKSTRLNSSHVAISYAVFCLKKKTQTERNTRLHST